jgi:hypothetical protein
MLANVTQNFAVRVVPVNDPIRDKWGHAGYRAYVTGATEDADRRLTLAALEPKDGYGPLGVGYGASTTARMAILNAMDNYADKFGALCVADTNDVA